MPIEVRELNIKVSIAGDDNNAQQNAGSGVVGTGAPPGAQGAGSNIDPATLVSEAVEKVLEILKMRAER